MASKNHNKSSKPLVKVTSSVPPLKCPHCGNSRIVFKSKAALWECESCEERFSGNPPELGIHRLDHKAKYPKAIFFSYGHDDNRELVQLFKDDLEKRGHQIWFDEKDIGGWDDWKGKITRGIDSSQLAIAFMSKHSIRDPGVCRNEIAIAMNRFGAVYPVLLETGIEKDIPITIRHLQWPDLSQWKQIRDGSVPGNEWVRWYEERLLSLIDKIEGEATQFADETGVLERVLSPITAESKIVQHVPGFIGREWIFDAYRNWVDHKPDSRLFWIKAGPGVGKSAIASNLIHRERSAIVAGWFCDAKSSERKDPNSALRSIAFQLALRWEDYRIRLLRKLQLFANSSEELCEDARKELCKKDTHDLFNLLLAEPMTGLIWRDHKLVIVIDALDEATDDDGNNRITELISNDLNSLPPWIGFVVTSRPEADVVNQLHGFKPFEINARDPRNITDLQSWYSQHLGQREELSSLPINEQKQIEGMLIDRSGGMILYLKVIEEAFREGSLTVVKLEELESGLPGLYRRYYDSFWQRFQYNYDDSIKPLLRILLAAGGPLPEDLACETLGWSSEQFIACRNRLGSYVIENITGYELFHKTLAEWLSDKSSGQFHLDRSVGRQMLADVLFRELGDNEIHMVRWKALVSEWLLDWLPQLFQHNQWSPVYDLGSFFGDFGDYTSAELLLRRALVISEKSNGLKHSDTGACLNKIGLLLMTKGEYLEAEIILRRALAIAENIMGPESRETCVVLAHLGRSLRYMKSYTVAEPICRRSLAIAEKVMGPDHYDTGLSLDNLASLLHDMGDYEAAEPLLRRALAIEEKALGQEHPNTGGSLNNLGLLLHDMEDYEAAEPLLRRALAIAEKVGGPDHPKTGLCLNNLGLLLKDMGDYEAAEPLLRRALAIEEKVLGQEHPNTGGSLNNLGLLLQDMEDYEAAEPLLRRALAIAEKVFGVGSSQSIDFLFQLGNLLGEMGKLHEAEILLRRALFIKEITAEDDYQSTSIDIILFNLAELLSTASEFLAAEPLYRRTLSITEKSQGPKYDETLRAMQNLAVSLRDAGDIEKSEQLQREVMSHFISLHGKESLKVASAYSAMGKLMSIKGNIGEAESYYRKALVIRQTQLGENDKLTSLVRLRLNELLKEDSKNDN
jgi:tetratricopeptide (TPR) repeat protein/ribosomal protein S27E